MTPGQAACEEWTRAHKARHEGCNITSWEGLQPDAREAWERAAAAAIAVTGES